MTTQEALKRQEYILFMIDNKVESSIMDLIQEVLEIERTLSLEENK